MKKALMTLVLMTFALMVKAQGTITGKAIESESGESLPSATVKLLKRDSTLVKGVVTDYDGNFRIAAPADGKYILKISCVGFKNYAKDITVSGKNVALGKVSMKADAIMLEGATVTANAAKVTLKEDTFVYNAAAYRVPEGSVVEELVKRLPGAKVDDDGKITINGKEVKKILVDGKEFMTGDTKTAMKNLPTSVIERVKAYDEKSDLARVSGIDDGEEQTVLDFGVKRGMNKGMFANIDAGVGTEDRYTGRGMAAVFQDKIRVMGFLNANNTNDMGFPGGGGGGRFGGARNGLNASKMVGLNFNYEDKDKLKLNGNVRWNHRDGDVVSRRASENFVSQKGSFSNSLNQNFSRSDSWNANMRIEWMPDTMTNILFRPTFSYTKNDGLSMSESATFSYDPYLYTDNPLSDAGLKVLDAADSVMVNHNRNRGITYSDSKRAGGMLQINRKLSNNGRNITLQLNANYSDQQSKSLSLNNVHLYQVMNALGQDSTYQTNRWNLTPSKTYSYSAKLTYSEPIMKATYLQFSYQFSYNRTKSDRSTYDFSNLGEDFFGGLTHDYRSWDGYLNRLGSLGRPFDEYLDSDLSRYSEYKNYIHDIDVMLRVIRKDYNFNVGVKVQPQKTNFIQNYQGVYVDTVRTVTNITPTADFRWKISNVSQLRFNYRGSTSQPSMTDLLAITDDSDPLNITKGNPGLKPSFTNSLRLFYNNYIQKYQRAVMVNLSYQNTRNSISSAVTYDPVTGGRTSQPQNINGNWSTSAGFMFNTALDTLGRFYTNTFTDFSYSNRVGFLNLNNSAEPDKNTVKTTGVRETLTAGYRNNWLEFELTGTVNYQHTRNEMQPQNNMDTWDFSYGSNINVTLPWGMTLATNLGMNSRRGYSDASMNTNEFVWNAQLSQSFLKGSPLTVSLQWYDILQQQSTISRTISAMMRSDTEYNSINSYGMLKVTYRFNAFGGKAARGGMPGGPGGPGGPGMGGNRGGNRPPMGGGFGRPF